MTYVRISRLELVGDFTIDENLSERIREEIQAVAKSSPGFLSYDSGYDQEGNIVSVTRWETEEQAAGPYAQVGAWLAENVGEGLRLVGAETFESQASIVA